MLRRWVIHPLEALGVSIIYFVFSMLPVDAASAFGGWLARLLGPMTRAGTTAKRNLARIFPTKSEAERAEIYSLMWDNLGRTAAEHPHLRAFDPYRENSRVELAGLEHIDSFTEDARPALFFAGHLGNWELSPLAVTGLGLKMNLVYRAANNPWVDRLFQRGRKALKSELWPKGSAGAKQMLKAVKNGECLAMLVDQKMNDGIPLPLLGVEAMTAPAAADLALRFDCPLIPARVERLKGARFRVTFYPPIPKPDTGDRHSDVATMMKTVNEILGDWIRERPGQWLWVHNRWPNE